MILTRLTITIGFLAGLLATAATAHGETAETDRASTVKAGMVLNFIRYCEWPEKTFASDDSPLVLTVLGDGAMKAQLERTMNDQHVHGRSIEIRPLNFPKPLAGQSEVSKERLREFNDKLRTSQVLFVCDSERDHFKSALAALDNSDVLTISDIDDFAEQGGMLGLAIRSDKVAFDANPGVIQETKLKVSSQLLRLARTVKSRDQ